jgi:hypothetical protein
MKSFNSVFLAIGLALGFALTIASTPASAFGYVGVGVQYHSGGTVTNGAPVIVTQYPSGRVVVRQVPVVHVYPNGENLVHQNGGQRVYSQGYGGAATCYVECWHNGVSPNRRSGTSFSFGISAQGNF